MREFLSLRDIPFDERNIRRDPQAKAELLELTGELAVPVVVAGDQRVVGYDPEWLESILSMSTEETTAVPPRDSAEPEQGAMAAQPQAELIDTITDLVARVREELDYSAAKGDGAYRQGMHDGLRFAHDALVDILEQHGIQTDTSDSA